MLCLITFLQFSNKNSCKNNKNNKKIIYTCTFNNIGILDEAGQDVFYSTSSTIDKNSKLHKIQRNYWWPGFEYTFILDTPGIYTINLYFAEIKENEMNLRKFDVFINNNKVLSSFDIYRESGGKNKEIIKTFNINTILNENNENIINIYFPKLINTVNRPTISAIEILSDNDIIIPPPNNGELTPIRVNCGSNQNMVINGINWDADRNCMFYIFVFYIFMFRGFLSIYIKIAVVIKRDRL